jgi:hypothetical protein
LADLWEELPVLRIDSRSLLCPLEEHIIGELLPGKMRDKGDPILLILPPQYLGHGHNHHPVNTSGRGCVPHQSTVPPASASIFRKSCRMSEMLRFPPRYGPSFSQNSSMSSSPLPSSSASYTWSWFEDSAVRQMLVVPMHGSRFSMQHVATKLRLAHIKDLL